MIPSRSAGRTAYRGHEPPQTCQPQHDRPSRGSDKPARGATIFTHGAPQALIGCFEKRRPVSQSEPSALSKLRSKRVVVDVDAALPSWVPADADASPSLGLCAACDLSRTVIGCRARVEANRSYHNINAISAVLDAAYCFRSKPFAALARRHAIG